MMNLRKSSACEEEDKALEEQTTGFGEADVGIYLCESLNFLKLVKPLSTMPTFFLMLATVSYVNSCNFILHFEMCAVLRSVSKMQVPLSWFLWKKITAICACLFIHILIELTYYITSC